MPYIAYLQPISPQFGGIRARCSTGAQEWGTVLLDLRRYFRDFDGLDGNT